MKTSFTDEKIIQMIKVQESGEKIADMCRLYGISHGTFYKYKSKYRSMEPSDAKTGPAFRDPELTANLIDTGTTTCGAQKFPSVASAHTAWPVGSSPGAEHHHSQALPDTAGLIAQRRVLRRCDAWAGVNPAIGVKKFKEKSRDRFLQPD